MKWCLLLLGFVMQWWMDGGYALYNFLTNLFKFA